jgi:uncharacterized protein
VRYDPSRYVRPVERAAKGQNAPQPKAVSNNAASNPTGKCKTRDVKPFVVSIADLLHRPAMRRDETLSGPIEELVVTETVVPTGSTLTVAVRIEAVSDGVLVKGNAHVPWVSSCRRCLDPITGTTTSDFREMYSENPVEGDTYPIRHDAIDLELVAREAILLDLPLAPLCREECAGLCVTCGSNLNDGACSCPAVVTDVRWAGLSGLSFTEDPTNN